MSRSGQSQSVEQRNNPIFEQSPFPSENVGENNIISSGEQSSKYYDQQIPRTYRGASSSTKTPKEKQSSRFGLLIVVVTVVIGIVGTFLLIRYITRRSKASSNNTTPKEIIEEPEVVSISNDIVDRAVSLFSNTKPSINGARTPEAVEDVDKPKDCSSVADFSFMFDNRPNIHKSKDDVRSYMQQAFSVEDLTMIKQGQVWSDASLIERNQLAQDYVNRFGGSFVGNTSLQSLSAADFERFINQSNSYLSAADDTPDTKHGSKIDMKTVVDIVCKSSQYDQDVYLAGNVFMCTARCPPGFETVWFEPRDQDGKPQQVPVLDANGNPVVDENGRKVTEAQLPQPWCRAKCPVKLVSPSSKDWAYPGVDATKISSSFLNGDSIPALYDERKGNDSANWKRTDVGENDAYCDASLYTRQIQKTGHNIVCGWCTRDVGWNEESQTNNLKHKCDTDGRQYNMDFTQWCQRGRLTPLFLEETFNGGSSGVHIESSFCSSMAGREGKRKQSAYIQSPMACRHGDLLPVIASAYGYGPSDIILGIQPAIETLGRNGGGTNGFSISADKAVMRAMNTNFTGFLAACYARCPVWMTSHGPVEDHLCHETCPPNTYMVKELGQIGYCKKLAMVKRIYIADMMTAARTILNDLGRIIQKNPKNQYTTP